MSAPISPSLPCEDGDWRVPQRPGRAALSPGRRVVAGPPPARKPRRREEFCRSGAHRPDARISSRNADARRRPIAGLHLRRRSTRRMMPDRMMLATPRAIYIQGPITRHIRRRASGTSSRARSWVRPDRAAAAGVAGHDRDVASVVGNCHTRLRIAAPVGCSIGPARPRPAERHGRTQDEGGARRPRRSASRGPDRRTLRGPATPPHIASADRAAICYRPNAAGTA